MAVPAAGSKRNSGGRASRSFCDAAYRADCSFCAILFLAELDQAELDQGELDQGELDQEGDNMTNRNGEIPEAETVAEVETEEENPEFEFPDELYLGDPWAVADNCQLLYPDAEGGVPGTFASVLCACGQRFKIDLINDSLKYCPNCETAYTHALIIGREENPLLGLEMLRRLLVENTADEGDETEELDGAAEE